MNTKESNFLLKNPAYISNVQGEAVSQIILNITQDAGQSQSNYVHDELATLFNNTIYPDKKSSEFMIITPYLESSNSLPDPRLMGFISSEYRNHNQFNLPLPEAKYNNPLRIIEDESNKEPRPKYRSIDKGVWLRGIATRGLELYPQEIQYFIELDPPLITIASQKSKDKSTPLSIIIDHILEFGMRDKDWNGYGADPITSKCMGISIKIASLLDSKAIFLSHVEISGDSDVIITSIINDFTVRWCIDRDGDIAATSINRDNTPSFCDLPLENLDGFIASFQHGCRL